MNNFTFTQDNCKEESTSTWLIAVMQFGLKINLFKPFQAFKLKMKEVKYSVYQKLIITMMSVVIGCERTKDINEKLGIEKLALNMFNNVIIFKNGILLQKVSPKKLESKETL